MVIGRSLVVGCDGQIQWWVGWLVMGKSVVMGSVVQNRWCEIGEWVPKDGSAVGGLWPQQFF